MAWLSSSIPYFVVIDEEWWRSRSLKEIDSIPINQNITYDISRLYPTTQKQFISRILNKDFKFICNNMDKVNWWTIFLLEECQMVIPSGSLRANYAQTTFRMVSVGRNFKQRMILLSQRPSDVSTKALSRVGILYIGQHYESNDIKKISNFFNNDIKKISNFFNRSQKETYEMLSNLKIGQFMFLNPYEKILKKISTPLFETNITPKDYFEVAKPKKKGFWKRFWG